MTDIVKKSKDLFPRFVSIFDNFDTFMQGFRKPFDAYMKGEEYVDLTPKMDLKVNENDIEVVAEIPGMEKDNIDVSVKDNVLTISGEKKQSKEEKDENGKVYASEISYGSFSRSVYLGDNVDAAKDISADLKNGVLTVKVPTVKQIEAKKEETKKIEIR